MKCSTNSWMPFCGLNFPNTITKRLQSHAPITYWANVSKLKKGLCFSCVLWYFSGHAQVEAHRAPMLCFATISRSQSSDNWKNKTKQTTTTTKQKETHKKSKFRLLREFILEIEVLYTAARTFQNLTKVWLFMVPEQPKNVERNACWKFCHVAREYSVDRADQKLSSPYLHISIFV